MDNVGRLNAKLVVEGANIPITQEAEAELHRRHVLVIPDFIANAGGAFSARATSNPTATPPRGRARTTGSCSPKCISLAARRRPASLRLVNRS